MKVAVVILNYNGRQLLQQFLPTIIKFSGGAKIYVADNASNDGSVEFIKSDFAEIELIQNKENYGYAKGYNMALKHIEEEIICLLNNDVNVTENWLNPILDEFKHNSETAIIQPKILDQKNPAYFEYAGAAGGYIDKYGFPYCRGRLFETVEKDQGQYNESSNILWASGACIFIRNSVWKNLEGFDERFFAHMEEIDLCWRAFNKGYSATCITSSEVLHVGGATLNYGNPQKTYLNFRNSLYMLVKNVPKNVFATVLTRLILDGVAAFKFLFQLKTAHFLAIFRAHLSFYFNLSKCIEQRNTINSDRKYYQVKSVVWSYFIKGRKRFDCL